MSIYFFTTIFLIVLAASVAIFVRIQERQTESNKEAGVLSADDFDIIEG